MIIKHGLDQPTELTEIDRAKIVVNAADQLLEIPLTPKQLQAVFVTLGVRIAEKNVELLDDDELGDVLSPDWVSVSKAAELLGVNRSRAYAIVNAGGLETRDDMGSGLMVSVKSINERLKNPPKAGRRWPAK